jgi:hypothetical protein
MPCVRHGAASVRRSKSRDFPVRRQLGQVGVLVLLRTENHRVDGLPPTGHAVTVSSHLYDPVHPSPQPHADTSADRQHSTEASEVRTTPPIRHRGVSRSPEESTQTRWATAGSTLTGNPPYSNLAYSFVNAALGAAVPRLARAIDTASFRLYREHPGQGFATTATDCLSLTVRVMQTNGRRIIRAAGRRQCLIAPRASSEKRRGGSRSGISR